MVVGVPMEVGALVAFGCIRRDGCAGDNEGSRGGGKMTKAILRASRVVRGVARGIYPLIRLACLVINAHVIFVLRGRCFRSGSTETTRATRRTGRVGCGVALGNGPFTRLACLMVNAHAIFLHCCCVRSSGPETAGTAPSTLRIGLGVPLSFSPFTRLACLVSKAYFGLILSVTIRWRFRPERSLPTRLTCGIF